eukprot:350247-Chlamydomonas_euryale.AAC.4
MHTTAADAACGQPASESCTAAACLIARTRYAAANLTAASMLVCHSRHGSCASLPEAWLWQLELKRWCSQGTAEGGAIAVNA